ncbi:hypothetical protein [Geodermatophilus sp. URMC 64]
MTMRSRIAAPVLGVGAVVLLNVGNELTKIGGGSPDLHASPEGYADAVGSSPLGIVGIYLAVVAWLAVGGFFRVVAERLRGTADGDRAARAVAAGGVLAAAVGISGALPLLAATVMAGDGDLTPELAKALQLMNGAVFVLGWLVVAVPLGIAALAGMRARVLGRVHGWSGVVVAALLAAASLAVWWVEGLVLVWLLGMVWIAATGVALARRVPAVEPVDGLVGAAA